MQRAAVWLVLIGVGLALDAAAQAPSPPSPLGRWLSETKRGVIEIYPCADRLCGKLVWLIEPVRRGAPALDDNNPDPALRQRPLCGLTMLGDFRLLEPQRWGDGWIYDPDSGKTYHATLAVEGETLRLRGYVGIPLFGETQRWTRPDGSYGSC
ncbi:MAG TPA: DUF2147 domain-containing protein [Stellaceae bacterium]|nr:DUF2147 domain-containing protein [Stellaceae bacterium]